MRQRRLLPSRSQLLALEAVIQSGSVTAAAAQLDLTQSTVSRLIQSLETQLGQELFTRQRKRLVPSPAALNYANDISRALDMIQRASMSVIANPTGGVLSLAVLPTFATRWLGPRLSGFLDTNPGISVNTSSRIQRFDFDNELFDAAIYFGTPDWPNTRATKLFDERFTACASSAFLAQHPINAATDVAALPLLQLETRASGWQDWFAGQDAEYARANGMLMDQFSMMVQAAISGLGIALLPDYLARIEIAEKRLEPVLKPAVAATGAYWLVWPEDKSAYPPLTAFRAWIATQSATAPL